MGRRVFELLHERIEGVGKRPRTVILPTTFIERGSGEIPPAHVARAAPRRVRSSTTNRRTNG